MRLRPCIDIHNGKVKQIVGGSLADRGDRASNNYISEMGAEYFAALYHERGLRGGHVILLNPASSPYYEATLAQALKALSAFPGDLMAGGGINPENAGLFLDAGASHVIVTSYVFKDGRIDYGHLEKMVAAIGRDKLVLDLSCRRSADGYRIVTDRWQKESSEILSVDLMKELAGSCSEFLVHAVDVEGKMEGPQKEVVTLLGEAAGSGIVSTYAGGIHNFADLELIRSCGGGLVDYTIGSALDLFGGDMAFEEVVEKYNS